MPNRWYSNINGKFTAPKPPKDKPSSYEPKFNPETKSPEPKPVKL
jgi:hypothetical protein